MNSPDRRDHALDGLRGIAALTVVSSHVLLISSRFAGTFIGPAKVGSIGWLFANTPLAFLLDGQIAVVVFFVLSGLVLTLPLLRDHPTRTTWAAYYPRRLLRLYTPVWAAVLLGLAWVAAVPHRHHSGSSWWLDAHNHPASARGTVRDLTLVHGVDHLITPLWSLQWEVIFSLLLPTYYLVAVRARGSAMVKIAGLVVLTIVGAHRGSGSLEFLPIFGLGAVLASHLPEVIVRAERLGRRWHVVALVVAVLLLTSSHLVVQGHVPVRAVLAVCAGLQALGALLIVALVSLSGSPARSLCRSRAVWHLGRVSFSLYLTHEPLVVSLAYLLGGHPNVLLLYVIALPAALLLAYGFMRAVEGPATDVSRWVGRRVAASR